MQQGENNVVLYVVLALVCTLAVVVITFYLVRYMNRQRKFVHNLKTRDEGDQGLAWGKRRQPLPVQESVGDASRNETEINLP